MWFILLLNEDSSIGIRIGLLIISGVSIGLQFQSSLLSAQLAVSKDIPGATILVTVFLDFVKILLPLYPLHWHNYFIKQQGKNTLPT